MDICDLCWAGYTRISQDRNDHGLAHDRQRKSIAEILSREGVPADRITWYKDTASAYRRNVKRPDYDRMLKAFQRGDHHGLGLWALDRLTRRLRTFEPWLDVADQRDIQFRVSVGSGAELSTPMGRAMLRVALTFAQMEVELKGERQAEAWKQKAERGLAFVTRRRPFGLDEHFDGTPDQRRGIWYTENKDEVQIIQFLTEWSLAGKPAQAAIEEIRRSGWHEKTPYRVDIHLVRRVLCSPYISGRTHYDGVLYPATNLPVIIPPDTQDRLIAIYSVRKGTVEDRFRTRKYLGTGLLWCACGCRLRGAIITFKTNGVPTGKGYRYHCQKRQEDGTEGCGGVSARGPWTDDILKRATLGFLSENQTWRNELARIRSRRTYDSRAPILKAELDTINRKLDELDDAHSIDPTMDLTRLTKLRQPLVTRQQELSTSLADIDAESAAFDVPEDILSLPGSPEELEEAWGSRSVKDQHAIAARVISRVTFHPGGSTRRNPDQWDITLTPWAEYYAQADRDYAEMAQQAAQELVGPDDITGGPEWDPDLEDI